MPLVALAFVLLMVLIAPIVLMPAGLVMRYRMGTAQRQARGWLAALNMMALLVSTLLFLLGSAIASRWVPDAVSYTLLGLAVGGGLGLVGLWLTRWEAAPPESLLYTPNRGLVLLLSLVVTSRLLVGFWRSWQTWQSGVDDLGWIVAYGAAGSLAAGAIVLGYYLVYWAGVRSHLKQHRRRLTLRPR